MFELSIRDHICSAHFLRGYEGKCQHVHGHTWKIEVYIQNPTLNQIGMVEDFMVLKRKLKDFLKPLDHVCLNDLDIFKDDNPTTENIAKYIYQNFAKEITPLRLDKVRVWESDTANVTYFE